MPKFRHWITNRLGHPKTARAVLPLTAASQPQLDAMGPSNVDRYQLALGWVGYHDAVWACQSWHYSKSMPVGKTIKVGVWESGQFIGVIIFSRGSTPKIGHPYGLNQTEVCELTRVALDAHKSPVSRIVSEAIARLKATNPGLRLIISYAAVEEGHHGGIYQAGNWIYEGSKKSYKIQIEDELVHGRTMSTRLARMGLDAGSFARSLGKEALPRVHLVRHKYLMPLDRKMRRQIVHLSQEYPNRS